MNGPERRGRALVVAGTDTGVGKTIVAGGLAAVLRSAGFDAGVMKPVESGCPVVHGKLVPEDALFLRRISGIEDGLELINQYALEHALTPALAAGREGVDIKMELVLEAFDELSRRHELVLVEGAGGLLSPLAAEWSLPDLAKELKAPVLLVARNFLGAINQCLLAAYYLRQEGIPLMAIVLNQVSLQHGLAEELNPAAIRSRANVPVLGPIPFMPETDDSTVVRTISQSIDLGQVTKWLRT